MCTLAKELPSGNIARKHKEDRAFSIYGPDGVTFIATIQYADIDSLANVISFDEIDELTEAKILQQKECAHPDTSIKQYKKHKYCDDCGAYVRKNKLGLYYVVS